MGWNTRLFLRTREWLKVIFHPKNLFKTVLSQVPIASAGNEIISQVESHEAQKQMAVIVAEVDRLKEVKLLEANQQLQVTALRDWSHATAEFLTRTIDLCVVYDGKFDPYPRPGRQLFKVVGHGCVIDKGKVLTCIETVNLALSLAEANQGRLIAAHGLIWYDLVIEQTLDFCGLVTCRILEKDEKKWSQINKKMKTLDLGGLTERIANTPVRGTVMPWLGQDIGLLFTGEADDVASSMEWPALQFEATAISHFQKFSEGSMKSFVSGALASRFLHAGAPVFSREAVLLGILSDSLTYKADSGRRAVVRSLLGHPAFTKAAKKSG